MIQGIDKQYGLELEKEVKKSTGEKETRVPIPEKLDELIKQNELEEGAIYTVEELEKVFEEEKEQPFKIHYQLFNSSAADPITDKKMTKIVSQSY